MGFRVQKMNRDRRMLICSFASVSGQAAVQEIPEKRDLHVNRGNVS